MSAAAGGGGDRRVGLLLCLVSAAGFGSLAIFGKQAYASGLGVVEVLVLRFGIAGPLLLASACGGEARAFRSPTCLLPTATPSWPIWA